ncbi:MAG TPA: hypothetical protein PLD27_08620 [bacterium]|nr:hypothetical protein [bacterium]HOL48566.1 hypothetical protein [bacterium]HPQ19239.1 hypothetical protein [bacterium]
MIYWLILFLSLFFSALFGAIIFYFLRFDIRTLFLISTINFFLLNFSSIIFFRLLRRRLLKIYKIIRTNDYKKINKYNFGDDVLNQLKIILINILTERNNLNELCTKLKNEVVELEEEKRILKLKIKDKAVELEEDYQLQLTAFDKIERIFSDLNINYQKEMLKQNNLFQKIEEVKSQLKEPEQIIDLIIKDILSSLKTIEKEKNNLLKLQEESQKLKDLFTTIKNNISYDISNLEQIELINKNIKTVIVKNENKNELLVLQKELENVLNSFKSIDRTEQEKIFLEFEKLSEVIYLTIHKIKIFNAFEMFLTSLTNNLNNLKAIINNIKSQEYNEYYTKSLKEIEELSNAIRVYLGDFVNFKNDFQDFMKIVEFINIQKQ